MQSLPLLDCAGRRRSPATTSSFHQGLPPRNKGRRYPPDPPTVEEIIAVMRAAGDGPDGVRLRGVIVMLWRAGLRISEALSLNETDLDPDRGAVLVRHGKGEKRREVGMDRWAWAHLEPWLEVRRILPAGALLCVMRGRIRGRPCAPAAIRGQLHRAAQAAGVRRRFAPHQLRHAHAVEMSREGISLIVIQRQLGHYVGDRSSSIQVQTPRIEDHQHIMLEWVTRTGTSAARIYWEGARAAARAAGQTPPEVSLPVAFTVFPDEIFKAPRSWAEQVYPNLIYFNEVDRGGHFAAWEEPELFATELRAAFRSLR